MRRLVFVALVVMVGFLAPAQGYSTSAQSSPAVVHTSATALYPTDQGHAGLTLPSPHHLPIVIHAKKQPPAGASAECKDGSYSFSKHRRGTCSHHRGVKKWLKNLPA